MPPRLPVPPYLALEALVVATWVVVLGVLASGNRQAALDQQVHDTIDLAGIPKDSDEKWFGVYLQGAKVGTAVSASAPLADGGLRIWEHSVLRLTAFGRTQKVRTTTHVDTDPALRARRFAFRFDGEGGSIRAEGAPEGSGFRVHLQIPGSAPQALDLPEPPVLGEAMLRAVARDGARRGGLAVGQRYRVPSFDPVTQARREVEAQVVRQTPEGLFEVRYTLAGGEATATIDTQGELYRDTGLLGMEIRRESRQVALNEGWPQGSAPDLIALSAVPVDKKLADARSVTHLRVVVDGPASLDPLLAQAHGAGWDAGTRRLTVDVPRSTGTYPIPLADERYRPWLKAEPGIEAESALVRAKAGEILGETRDAREAARLLNRWVFTALDKKSVVGVPSALQVLSSLEGDCNEHTALFTALARAAGLPVRVAAGIVYTDSIDPQGSFYYHAWPVVWLGDAWVPVDPTFGQFPADATHLQIVEGGLDQQVDLVGVIGRLSLRVEQAE